MTKTLIQLNDKKLPSAEGWSAYKTYTLRGKWSRESVERFLSRRPLVSAGNPEIRISYI